MTLSPLLVASATAWLTPIWLIGAGCLAGLVVLAALYGVLRLLNKPAAATVAGTVHEGFLFPVLATASVFAGFAVLSLVLSAAGVGYLPLDDLSRSLVRLPASKSFDKTFTVPPASEIKTGEAVELEVDYRPQEIGSFKAAADRALEFYLNDPATRGPGSLVQKIELEPGEPWVWPEEGKAAGEPPFSGRRVTVYAINIGEEPVTLTIEGKINEEYPEVASVPYTAALLIGVVLLYLLARLTMPRIMAIASVTSKEAVAQPLFQILLALGIFALLLYIYIPYNTFGEDVKMLKMGSLELIKVLGILVAAFTASISVADEIEGRTALTVLSKPVGRIQFILGKFFGIVQAVSLLFLFLGAVFLVTVSYKVVYNVRESVLQEAQWTDCYYEMISIVPGLVLALMETTVLAAISVAIATRLAMLPNLIITFSIYALGNIAPMLVQSRVHDPYGIVHFFGKLFATILPVLENFSIQAAISADRAVPISYLGWALLYCGLYSTIAMLLALALFEDRDLA